MKLSAGKDKRFKIRCLLRSWLQIRSWGIQVDRSYSQALSTTGFHPRSQPTLPQILMHLSEYMLVFFTAGFRRPAQLTEFILKCTESAEQLFS